MAAAFGVRRRLAESPLLWPSGQRPVLEGVVIGPGRELRPWLALSAGLVQVQVHLFIKHI